MWAALYNSSTGVIQSTISAIPSTQEQIDALASNGLGFIEIDPSVNGHTHMVDVKTKQLIDIVPSAPVPDLMTQLAAALINSGLISASAIHPATIADMNSVLSDANMNTVGTKAS